MNAQDNGTALPSFDALAADLHGRAAFLEGLAEKLPAAVLFKNYEAERW